jgi:flagellar protein FlaG
MTSELSNVSQRSSVAAGTTAETSVASVQTKTPTATKDPVLPNVDMQKLHQDLTSSIEKINQAMRDGGRNLSFSVDPSVVGGPVVSVKNSDTGEIVRQIPNEAVVRVAHNIDALKGVLYNGLS